jgi:hypothetical protein
MPQKHLQYQVLNNWLMTQAEANPSQGQIPCEQGKEQGIWENRGLSRRMAHNIMQHNQWVD